MLIPCLVIIIVVQITDLPSRYDGDKGVQVCVCVSVCVYMRVIQDELIGFYWKFRAWVIMESAPVSSETPIHWNIQVI